VIDMLMDYEDAVRIVKSLGFDGWVKHVAQKFPYHKLHSASTAWYEDGPKYIAKLRGLSGDVIIDWKK